MVMTSTPHVARAAAQFHEAVEDMARVADRRSTQAGVQTPGLSARQRAELNVRERGYGVKELNNGASGSCFKARWTREERGILLIVDETGNVVSSCPVAQDCDRPDWEMLLAAGWCAYPGSEWEEEPPGRWEIAVFQDSLPGNTRGGAGHHHQQYAGRNE